MLDLRYFRTPAFSGALGGGVRRVLLHLRHLLLRRAVPPGGGGRGGYRTALQFAPMAAAMVVASAFTGRWVARAGSRLPMALGCVAGGWAYC